MKTVKCETYVHTPWGPAQYLDTIADGIEFYSTAGHGGIKLSPERHAAVQQSYPNFTTFAGGAWYEEDCDVAVVMATFPEYFGPESVAAAQQAIQNDPDYYKISR